MHLLNNVYKLQVHNIISCCFGRPVWLPHGMAPVRPLICTPVLVLYDSSAFARKSKVKCLMMRAETGGGMATRRRREECRRGKSRRLEPVMMGERREQGVSGEAEKGESLSQVGLPKHDGLFTCQVVAFVWASHERQKRRSFSSSPSRTTSVVWVCECVCVLQRRVLMLEYLSSRVFV